MAQVDTALYSKYILPTLNFPSFSKIKHDYRELNRDFHQPDKLKSVQAYKEIQPSFVHPVSYFSDIEELDNYKDNTELVYRETISSKEDDLSQKISDLELVEEELSEEEGNFLYNFLFKQPKDEKRVKFIKDSLNLFPNPSKTMKFDIDI